MDISTKHNATITKAQRRVLRGIKQATQRSKPATVRSITRLAGYRSYGTVYRYLSQLEQGGWISMSAQPRIRTIFTILREPE